MLILCIYSIQSCTYVCMPLHMCIIRQIYIPHLYCRMREDYKTMAAVVWHHF